MGDSKADALIDSHCHLDFDKFDTDRESVIGECQGQGITKILVPGVSSEHWQRQIDLCQHHPMLTFALGLHPYFLSDETIASLEKLDALLSEHKGKVVAVGEIGLDGYVAKQRNGADERKQLIFFEEQLNLASKHALPVVIHHRQSHNHIIRLLKQKRFHLGGVIHAFSGSLQEAKSYIELGFMLGAGGTITYDRAAKTRQVFKTIGLEHILLETDAPDMPLQGFQGQRNSPVRVVAVAECLAELRGESVQYISQQTDKNFHRLFVHLSD